MTFSAARRALVFLAAALLALLLPGTSAFAGGPADVVPRGDIAYDLLASLAGAGRLPGRTRADFFRGDRLYTRGEMARVIAGILPSELLPDQGLALSSLVRRFHSELSRIDAADEAALAASSAGSGLGMGVSGFVPVEQNGRIVGERPSYVEALANPKGARGFFAGQVKLRGLTDPAAGHLVGRAAGLLPLGRDGFAAVSVGNFRDEWHDGSHSSLGGSFARQSYPAVETAMIRVDGRALNVTLGRMPLRWGPGYAGALLFSDEAPAITQIHFDKSFRLPGTLGRRLGRLHFSQFAGQFSEAEVLTAAENARGTRRYVLGRRFQTEGSGPWDFSVAEAFKSTRLPDAWAPMILPFYTYQNDWTKSNKERWFGFLASGAQPNTFWLNYMVDVGASYRADARGTRFYADLLADDLKAPKGLGKGDETPRKIGAQVGVHIPDLGGQGRYAARLEYATIDLNTYTNISPPIAWAQDGLPLGHPTGPNARVFFGRLDATLTEKVTMAVEGAARRRASNDGPEANAERIGLYASYAASPSAFFGARLEYRRITPPGATSDKSARAELNAGIGF